MTKLNKKINTFLNPLWDACVLTALLLEGRQPRLPAVNEAFTPATICIIYDTKCLPPHSLHTPALTEREREEGEGKSKREAIRQGFLISYDYSHEFFSHVVDMLYLPSLINNVWGGRLRLDSTPRKERHQVWITGPDIPRLRAAKHMHSNSARTHTRTHART